MDLFQGIPVDPHGGEMTKPVSRGRLSDFFGIFFLRARRLDLIPRLIVIGSPVRPAVTPILSAPELAHRSGIVDGMLYETTAPPATKIGIDQHRVDERATTSLPSATVNYLLARGSTCFGRLGTFLLLLLVPNSFAPCVKSIHRQSRGQLREALSCCRNTLLGHLPCSTE